MRGASLSVGAVEKRLGEGSSLSVGAVKKKVKKRLGEGTRLSVGEGSDLSVSKVKKKVKKEVKKRLGDRLRFKSCLVERALICLENFKVKSRFSHRRLLHW